MDLILYNGRGYTMDQENSQIEAIAIKGNTVKAIGNSKDIIKLKDNKTVLIDLQGKTFIPGLNDSHLHLYSTGISLFQVNLLGVISIQEVKNKVKKFITPEMNWILGRGWNQDYFTDENRFINRSDLDDISKEHPIALKRACGHMLVANSKAIELAGVTKEIKLDDGDIDLEKGIFTENAMDLIMNVVPKPTIENVKSTLIRGMNYANSLGITSLQTDDLFTGVTFDKQLTLQALLELEKDFQLTTRIYEQSLLQSKADLDHFLNAGFYTGYGNEFFKIGPLKLLADGSLGARTAALTNPYKDDQSTKGMLIYKNEELHELITHAHKNNMQIAVHCIGDAAMEQVLDIYEDVLKKFPKDNHRHGIVHCQIMTKEIHEKFASNNVIAYIQPIFIHYDHRIVEARVGHELAKTSYAFKSLLNRNVHIAMGTDSPIENINPFENIYCAVTRKSLDGNLLNGWFPEEALSVEEALYNYTVGSSYASFSENYKGKLIPEYLADLTVISDDIFNIPLEKIKSINVLLTIVDGRVVYEKDDE